jgi:hypothetical protein
MRGFLLLAFITGYERYAASVFMDQSLRQAMAAGQFIEPWGY